MCANDKPGRVVWPSQCYPLTLAISEDGGQTWPYRRHIDTGDNFAGDLNNELNRAVDYPALIQTRDGRLHVAYSYRGRQCIKYASVGLDWVKGVRGSAL